MKGKTRAVLLCVILAAALLCSASGALAEEPTATPLEQLINLLKTGGTYQLSEDITLDADVFCKASSTLDLNGHTLHADRYRIVIYNSYSLTVKDSSPDQTGKITGTNTVLQSGMVNQYGRVYSGRLYIESGTIESDKNTILVNPESTLSLSGGKVTARTSAIVNSGGTVNINGGTVATTSDLAIQNLVCDVFYQTIFWETGKNYYGGTLNVYGGTVETDGEIAIANEKPAGDKKNVVNITGGTVTAATEAVLNKCTATISGGEISADEYAVVADGTGELDIKAGSIHAQDYAVYVTSGKATISNGTVYTTEDEAYTVYVTGDAAKSGSVSINGGLVRALGADAIGVYLDEYSHATVRGGTIEAEENGGCGLYAGSGTAQLDLSGGTLSAYDCCVMISGYGSPDFYLGGAPAFQTQNTENSDIEILNLNCMISIDSKLTNTTPISVRLGGDREGYDIGGVFTQNYHTFHSADDHPGKYFTTKSDSSEVVWADDSHLEARITGHVHDLSYYLSTDGTTLYAECENDGCFLTEEELTFTMLEPDDPVYNEAPKKVALSEGFLEELFPDTENSIDYYAFDETENDWILLNSPPVNPGLYWAEYTGKADVTQGSPLFAGIEFEIQKIKTGAWALPYACEGLIYDGTSKELIVPGRSMVSADFVYAVGDDNSTVPGESQFTEEIPAAAEPGTYYIWYWLPPEDEFHTGIGPACLETTIVRYGSVRITAVDQTTGEPLEGAVFYIGYEDDEGRWVDADSWSSDDQGYLFQYLEPGRDYILGADSVPEGYAIPGEIRIRCDGSLEVQTDPQGLINQDGVLTVTLQRVYKVLSDGTVKAVVYNWIYPEEIERATPGTTINLIICDEPEMYLLPGCYYTGAFTVNGEPLGYNLDGIPIESFDMPGEDVRISAVRTQQKAITLDFSRSGSLTIPYMAVVQMRNGNRTWKMFGEDENGNELIDLDQNGTYDLAVREPENENRTEEQQPDGDPAGEYELTLLDGNDAIGYYEFTFDGYDEEYGSIAFILPGPAFENPAFVLPEALTEIEESAFEGNTGISTVRVSDACETIGRNAFAGCTGLRQIRLPVNCAIDEHAFDGCEKVYVYAKAGGTTEAWCAEHDNCVFVEEIITESDAE